MQIVKFSVKNYRSITSTNVLELGSWTVLVGPNNEGKSNILRALVTAVEFARSFRLWTPGAGRAAWAQLLVGQGRGYTWATDFPLQLQALKPDGETEFRLWFRLSPSEKAAFRRQLGSRLESDLSLTIRIGAEAAPKVKVDMPGPGHQALNSKVAEIARFVGARLDIEHIPAVRTAERAQEVVARLVDEQLAELERSAAYRGAVEKIAELQRPVLVAVGETVSATLREFLPAVSAVEVKDKPDQRLGALRRSYELVVNDGTSTPLAMKGDGVQSIAALSLLRSRSSRRAGSRDLILAVEEPEAHLHPGAIHGVLGVLRDISATTQVVMTTHHPVFVDRRVPSNNVIVQGGKARPARSIQEVRESLGVLASDNLRTAEVLLLVEGRSDKLAVDSLLRTASGQLKSCLDSGRLAIFDLGGVDTLSYHATIIRNELGAAHAFLDADNAGRQAAASAQAAGVLAVTDVTLASSRGNREAEIEDMYRVEAYAPQIANAYGVRLPSPAFEKSRAKWAGRMEAAFADQGKDWGACSGSVKLAVAEAVAAQPSAALDDRFSGPFQALAMTLEGLLTP